MPETFKSFLRFWFEGSLGVRIFFVISGFLITYLLIIEKQKKGKIDLFKFYIRRSLRIFPVFYFYLLVLFILKISGVLVIDGFSIVGALLYLENFKIAPFNWMTGHSWSLAVEEQFYLIWPGLFLFFRDKFSIKIVVLVLMLGGIMRGMFYKYTDFSKYLLAPFFMHADFLFVGCFIGYLFYYRQEEIKSFVSRLNGIHIFLLVCVMWCFTKMEYHPVWDKFFIPVTGIVVATGFAIILLYTIFRQDNFLFRFLNKPGISFVGKLSYSLYVWQQLFLCGTLAVAANQNKFWFQFPQNMAFVGLASIFSYFIVEKPFLKIKSRFAH